MKSTISLTAAMGNRWTSRNLINLLRQACLIGLEVLVSRESFSLSSCEFCLPLVDSSAISTICTNLKATRIVGGDNYTIHYAYFNYHHHHNPKCCYLPLSASHSSSAGGDSATSNTEKDTVTCCGLQVRFDPT